MTDLDRMIEEALDEEDRALLEQFGEQGIWGQVFGMFDTRMRPLVIFATVLSFGFFIGGVICVWNFFHATDPVLAIRWAAAAGILMIWIGFLKIWFWLRMESNRLLREIKRVELQVARLQARETV